MDDKYPSQARLKELFAYDPDTGALTNRVWRNGLSRTCKKAGTLGLIRGQYYLQVSVDGRQHPGHRLIWLYMTGNWPAGYDIDHANGDGSDNRWANLRLATPSQNGANSKISKNNKSGFKGVVYEASRRKWRAEIRHNGKLKNLGRYATAAEAHGAYIAAALTSFGQFARSG